MTHECSEGNSVQYCCPTSASRLAMHQAYLNTFDPKPADAICRPACMNVLLHPASNAFGQSSHFHSSNLQCTTRVLAISPLLFAPSRQHHLPALPTCRLLHSLPHRGSFPPLPNGTLHSDPFIQPFSCLAPGRDLTHTVAACPPVPFAFPQ